MPTPQSWPVTDGTVNERPCPSCCDSFERFPSVASAVPIQGNEGPEFHAGSPTRIISSDKKRDSFAAFSPISHRRTPFRFLLGFWLNNPECGFSCLPRGQPCLIAGQRSSVGCPRRKPPFELSFRLKPHGGRFKQRQSGSSGKDPHLRYEVCFLKKACVEGSGRPGVSLRSAASDSAEQGQPRFRRFRTGEPIPIRMAGGSTTFQDRKVDNHYLPLFFFSIASRSTGLHRPFHPRRHL